MKSTPNLIHKRLVMRAEVLHLIRGFFRAHDFLEVETPIRIPTPLPEAHIDLIGSEDWVLQPSPEICMKPLLAAGCDRIFQICKCFRKGERGRRHLPEMTMLEWYAAAETYSDLMTRTEELIRHIAQGLGRQDALTYQGERIDLTPPWPRLTIAEVFKRFASLPVDAALAQERFDELMGVEIEPQLGRDRPVFIHDYPAACGSLARLNPEDQTVAERFELYIGGLELCNGFSELTDPIEQRRRFELDREVKRQRGQPVHGMPEIFLKSLASLPPCAGNALGVDRLVMLFTDAAAIDEVVAYTPEKL